MKKLFLLALMMLLAMTAVLAVQPSHNSVKIFLSPFYVNSMTQNVNTSYNFSTITPDGMSQIKSAIITVDAWISPTRTFNGWVNGVRCNTRDYLVSTTFAAAGRAVITLDCSNAVKPMANNTFNFTVSGGNIGSSTAWIDITYVNNPVGEIKVSGTEYSPGDSTTAFLQLVDNNNVAVNNASCYIDMWSPANASSVHPKLLTAAPMLSAIGSEGIYYYDMIAPSTLGVYMIAAKCTYSYNYQWLFPDDDLVNYPRNKNILGTWSSNASPVLNTFQDGLYQSCTNSGGASCTAIYDFNLSTLNYSSANVSSINMYYAGQESTNPLLTVAYYNGSAYVNLANTLGFVGTGSATPLASRDQFLTNTVPVAAILSNNTITLRLSLTGAAGAHSLHNNWLSVSLINSAGTPQEVKGSSEMHITNVSEMAAVWVWNASNRTITQNFSTVTNITTNFTTNITINSTTVNYTNNFTNNITFNSTTINYTNNFTNNITFNSTTVNYTNNFTNNITFNSTTVNYTNNITFNTTEFVNYTTISTLINTSQLEILTNTTTYFTSVLGNISLVADNVWNYVGRYIHGIIN